MGGGQKTGFCIAENDCQKYLYVSQLQVNRPWVQCWFLFLCFDFKGGLGVERIIVLLTNEKTLNVIL